MTTWQAAEKIISTKREWAAKRDAYRRSAGLSQGCLFVAPDQYPAFREARALVAEKCAGTQLKTFVDWPAINHDGTIGTQRWIIDNITIDWEAKLTA